MASCFYAKTKLFFAKKDPPVPQNEKVLTRFSQVGAPLCRFRLSVHKQTLPIGTDHLQSAPEFQMWIKIIRTPNTADRIYSLCGACARCLYIIYYTTFSENSNRIEQKINCKILLKNAWSVRISSPPVRAR